MDQDKFTSELKSAVQKLADKFIDSGPHVVTDCVVVFETYDGNDFEVRSLHTLGQRPWLRIGLLSVDSMAAQNQIAHSITEIGDGDEAY